MRSRLGLAPGGRTELLLRLSRTGGVCVPSRYDVVYADDATIVTVTPNCVGVPERVSTPAVTDLGGWPYPRTPLVPVAGSVLERMP